MSGRTRNLLIVIGALALVVVIAVVASKRSGSQSLAVREAPLKYATFQTKLPETGVVQRPLLVTIPAGVSGNVGFIWVKAGDRVQQGQLLATIVNPQLESSLHAAEASAASARGHARSAVESNQALPAQNRSSIVQAEAAVLQAQTTLSQARQDLISGQQSGLGFSGGSAQEQRLAAQAALDRAATDLREAKRTYDANLELYNQKAVSRDQVEQSKARYEQSNVTWQQAKTQRQLLEGQLSRARGVLRDRVRATQDGLRQAQASLAAAKANAAQTKLGDVSAAQADASRASADLSFARDQVDRMQLRAPVSGTVQSVASQPGDTLRPLQPGDPVTAGQGIVTLAGQQRFIVRTKVDEQDIANVRIGQRAVVSGEDFAGKRLTGRVASISPVAQKSDDPSNTSRQVLTTIALDNTLPFLRDGMSVDVDIVTRDLPHVLAVPVDALRKDPKGADFVYVVKSGRATRADVKLGAQSDTSAVVTSGLQPGDVVIADKNIALAPNAKVTAAPSPSPGPSVRPSGS
ncbi:MAG: efflux RND transporter periplasmic adaptor subunit [Candidatus Eremiobacteraeota bacterium]|nr:efflux RND transporter periplasmic adaptor subunit [Candidatus Eremiobacteraeota bacterium]